MARYCKSAADLAGQQQLIFQVLASILPEIGDRLCDDELPLPLVGQIMRRYVGIAILHGASNAVAHDAPGVLSAIGLLLMAIFDHAWLRKVWRVS